MARFSIVPLALLAGQASLVAAQAIWSDGQVSTSMCYWEQLRASVVRDTVYLDGGALWWLPGNSDGSFGPAVSDNNPLGIVYTLNFSTPFNVTQNLTAVLGTLYKAGGGAANNIAPNYFDGAMLANNDEWFLFGGLLQQTAAFTPPGASDVFGYQKYQYGIEKPGFVTGFVNKELPDGMTRYISYGGAANAPSENKAWYFSGMHSPSWGPIYTVSANKSVTPSNVSNSLIQLDLTTQQQESWSNNTLPDFIHGRGSPELVWVPVGEQGILVALGGVLYPEFINVGHKSSNATGSEKESPVFMSTIDIYDIAGDTWYQQETVSGPGQLTRGCAVVAPAQDYSSLNIYYYGGYEGLSATTGFTDDVWVLSLPSFMWMKLKSGNDLHARAGHKCVMPYPDQMLVIGGFTNQTGSNPVCLDSNIIQIFNLTSGEWMEGYDPSKYYDYGVPDMIYNMIGGSATGGATLTTPSPSGWGATGLAKVFQTPYPTSKITAYYPYASTGPTNNTNPTYTATSSGSGLPKWVPPVLGVILGLILITTIGVAILLWRRRKLLRSSKSEASTENPHGRIISWMRGQTSEAKAPTVTTSDTPLSPSDMDSVTLPPPILRHHEMEDTQVVRAELMDTSPRAELHDMAMTPAEIINKHTHFAQSGSESLNNPSILTGISQTDHASTLSRSSVPQQQSRPTHISLDQQRPDSPALGSPGVETTNTPTRHVESGVSNLSERDRTHLRQISDTTVSSVTTGFNDRVVSVELPANTPIMASTLSEEQEPSTAVSPPSAGMVDGPDYISARRQPVSPTSNIAATSPLRRSIFFENEADLGHNEGSGS